MNYLVIETYGNVNVEATDCPLIYSDVYSGFELAKRVALDMLSKKITDLQGQYQDMLNFTEERCISNYEREKQIKRLG